MLLRCSVVVEIDGELNRDDGCEKFEEVDRCSEL